MEFKKNPRVDIHRRSSLFFNIGLVLSLFIVNTAFEWTNYDESARVDLEINSADINNFEASKEISNTIKPPIPQVKKIANSRVEKKASIADEMEALEMSVDLTVDLDLP